MLRYATCVLLFGGCIAHAALLQVSSSASMAPGGKFVSDSHTLTSDFTVMITGGTGSGYYAPRLWLSGMTNESGSLIQQSPVMGATAWVNWPAPIQVGDPYGPASSDPSFSCPGVSANCWVPFTFGVKQNIHFSASTFAAIQMDSQVQRALAFSGVTVSSSVIFDGIGAIEDSSGRRIAGQTQIAFNPEPGTGLMVLGALAGLGLRVRLRRAAKR